MRIDEQGLAAVGPDAVYKVPPERDFSLAQVANLNAQTRKLNAEAESLEFETQQRREYVAKYPVNV